MRLHRSNGVLSCHREFFGKVLKFGVPAIIETVMANVGGLLLGMIVGRNDVNDSYAAFSLALNVFNALSTITVALFVGITVVLLRHSVRESEEHDSLATTCIMFATAVSLILSAAAFLFAPQFIGLFYGGAEKHIFEATTALFRSFAPAMFMSLVSRALCAAYRGLSNFRIPVSVMILESLVTAALGFVFVEVGKMGYDGMVLTLTTARAIPLAVLMIIWLSGKSVMKFRLPRKSNLSETLDSVKIGFPTVLDSGGVQISYLILQSIMVFVGTSVLKGYQAANTLINFLYTISSGMNVALVTVAGGYFSMMKLRKAKACAWYFTALTYIAALTLAGIFCIFSDQLISMFIKSPEAHDAGRKILIGLCIDVLLTQFIQVMPALFKAIGDTKTVFIIGFTGSVCVRLPFAWLFIMKLHMGWLGIILALTVDFLYRFVFYLIKTYFVFRRHPIHAKHLA